MSGRTPVQQAKDHILKHLKSASSEVKEIVYPCLREDLADYRSALELVEVQAEFNRRGVKATIQPVTKTGQRLPDIVIATINDASNGRLDNFLRGYGDGH